MDDQQAARTSQTTESTRNPPKDVEQQIESSEPREEATLPSSSTPAPVRETRSSPGGAARGSAKRKRQASRDSSAEASETPLPSITEEDTQEGTASRGRRGSGQARGRKRARIQPNIPELSPVRTHGRSQASESREGAPIGTEPSKAQPPEQDPEVHPEEVEMPGSDRDKTKDQTSGKGKGKGKEYSDPSKEREGTADTAASSSQDGSKRGRSRTGYN